MSAGSAAPLGAPLVQTALGFAQPTAPTLRGCQLARRLVAALLAEPLILDRVDRVGLGEDLARDLLVAAGGVLGCVRVHLRAVDRDHPHLDHPGLGAEREHLAEQAGERRLVALTEARDRRVIGPLVRADHARGDILNAAPLDPPRGPLADRIDVEQQRHHHRRIVRRPTMTAGAIGRVERGQIHRHDGIDHKPRQVILGQPLAQARRQQQLLLAITRQEVLRHACIVLTAPDRHSDRADPIERGTAELATCDAVHAWFQANAKPVCNADKVETLRLESSRDGGVFELDQRHGKSWQATLTLPGLRAAIDVDGTGYGFGEGLSTYFRRIADDWRGWDGPRAWSSLEGEFDFQATHDGLGYVELRIRMRGGLDAEDWRAEGTIWIDAGQLDTLARAARSFDSSAGLAATD